MLNATVISAIDFKLVFKAERDLRIGGVWYFIVFGTPDECLAAAYVCDQQARDATDPKLKIQKVLDAKRLRRLAADPKGPPPRPRFNYPPVRLPAFLTEQRRVVGYLGHNVRPILAHPNDRHWPLHLLERMERLLEKWDFSYLFEMGTYEECLAAAAVCRCHASLFLDQRADLLFFAKRLEERATEADAREAIPT